jgi:hypothetical protein
MIRRISTTTGSILGGTKLHVPNGGKTPNLHWITPRKNKKQELGGKTTTRRREAWSLTPWGKISFSKDSLFRKLPELR